MKLSHLTHQVISYLNYRKSAVNRHGLHSPFLYHFNENVLRPGPVPEDCLQIQELVKEWKGQHLPFLKTDMGAGSIGGLQKERTLAQELKIAGATSKYGKILFKTISYLKPVYCVELGTSVGLSAIYQLAALKNIEGAKLITIEGCPNTAMIAKKNLDYYSQSTGISNSLVEVLNDSFDKALPSVTASIPRVDFAFIDGDHRGASILKYYEMLKPKLHPNSVLVFDDINWNNDMRSGWESLKKMPEVSISIDIFRMGFLFFREGIVKQDFVIKAY